MLGNKEQPRVSVIEGGNFSGRTFALKKIAGITNDGTNQLKRKVKAQYIGPDIGNFISGLATTIDQELQLFGGESWKSSPGIYELLELVGLGKMLNRSPYKLSGGEQVILTLATAISRQSERLCIDSSLEQLNSVTREEVLELLCGKRLNQKEVVIADNRYLEYNKQALESFKRPFDQEGSKKESPRMDASLYEPYKTMPARITGKSLRFSYPETGNIFETLNFDLEPGRVYVLTGKNGAGKTTLAKLLSGILKLDAGVVYVNQEPNILSKEPSAVCAYHFQNPELQLFATTCEEEIELSLSRNNGESISNILDSFGLKGNSSIHPADLPYTLKKRLALAAVFAMERPWIILDEPSLGQDDKNVSELIKIIQLQASQGTGIIIISHSQSMLARTSGIRLTLDNGKIGQA